MHRKAINRRTEIGNVCISLFPTDISFPHHFYMQKVSFYSEVILSNKGFHQQICFPKNAI